MRLQFSPPPLFHPLHPPPQFYANSELFVERLDSGGLSVIVNYAVEAMPSLGIPAFTFIPFRLTHLVSYCLCRGQECGVLHRREARRLLPGLPTCLAATDTTNPPPPAPSLTQTASPVQWADSPEGLQLNSSLLVGVKEAPYPGADSSIHGFVNTQARTVGGAVGLGCGLVGG
jgi:hypothetical protein